MDSLARAVHTVVNHCLGVRAGEQVLVIADTQTRRLGDIMREAATDAGADAVGMLMEPREVDGQEPPSTVAGALVATDVFIAPTTRSLSHTKARRAATDAGARGATLPGVSEDILARLMACDLPTLQRRSRALAELLTRSDEAHLTCPNGSDLRLDLFGRQGVSDDGDLSQAASFGNLPCGEGFISPCGGDGVIYATSLAGVGLTSGQPARLTVAGGELVDAEGPQGERLLRMLRDAGPHGVNLAELGIGTNERAGLIGNVIEDEKILGTIHVAFGASAGFGGTVRVPIHLDCVVLAPTLDVGATRVIEAGDFVFDA
jgi:leucyl aminopeptidase (aminopeptidase T)